MKPSSPSGPPVFLRIVMAVLGAIGLAALVSGLSQVASGGPNMAGAVTAVLMGAALTTAAAVFLYFNLVTGPREQQRREKLRITNPNQPWMLRADWAQRRVSHTSRGQAIGAWVFTLVWWGLLGFVGTVNHAMIVEAVAQSWLDRAVLAAFIGCGLIALALAVSFSRAWWRFGTSELLLDTLPATPGNAFRATLDARLGPAPYAPLDIELRCEELRTVVIDSAKDRETRTDTRVLGSSKAVADPARFVRNRDRVRVPVEIEVPKGFPGWNLDERGDGVRWALRISSTAVGGAYSAEFDVPVFRR